jgi:hypothetical protein
LRRVFGLDAQIVPFGRNKHAVGVFETAAFDPIGPDGESVAEGGSRLRSRTNEIRDHRAAGFNHAVAHPTHAPRMLNTVVMSKAEVLGQIGAHRVGVEDHGVQKRRQHIGECGLARARQAMIKILRVTAARLPRIR